MYEPKTVAINVVSWNSMAYLPRLFLSLHDQTVQDFSVTVVDNASDDGTIDWLQREHPETATLRNFRNQGFSRAHNQAIQLTLTRWPQETLQDRYVLVTNPDVEFAPSALERLVGYMDAHPEVMACGPKLLRARTVANEDGTRETERLTTIDSTGIKIRKSRLSSDRGAGEEDRGQYDTDVDVFGISGACLMVRASALPYVMVDGEVFDEDMFAYKEDVDLCWRMQRMGMRIRLVPQAVAWHHRRAQSGDQGVLWLKALLRRLKKPAQVNALSTRNHLWVLVKNDEWVNALLHAPWILPYEFGKFCIGIFQPAAWRATFQMFGGLPRMWKKRSQMEKNISVSGKAIRKYFV